MLGTVVHPTLDLFNPSVVAFDGWVVTGRRNLLPGAFTHRFDTSLAPIEASTVAWPDVQETPNVAWTGERLAIAYCDVTDYPYQTYLAAICP
ncbi:MAG: hypothetical protein H0T42_02995 [Deltaproteobacteria bacterium]|nr:hypothetical protein [Deltaproteobacteria bacterium]